MALLESVSGFRDLFTDPPEFDILNVSKRQQLTNFVRITLGGLGLVLLALQASGSPIACFPHKNQTKISNLVFVHETCIDDIKARDVETGNPFIIIDEFFGWMLVLEIICLMVITKVIARNEKSKQICRRFTELSEKILNTEKEDFEEQKEVSKMNVDQSYLVNKYNVFMKQLRENKHLRMTQLYNSLLCILLTLVFLVLNILALHGRNTHHEETVSCTFVTSDTAETEVDCRFPLFETVLYIGAIFTSLLVVEIVMQLIILENIRNSEKKCRIRSLYQKIQTVAEQRGMFEKTDRNCDLLLLIVCLWKKYDMESSWLVLAIVDKNIRKLWSSFKISLNVQSPRDPMLRYSVLSFDSQATEVNEYTVIKELDGFLGNIKLAFKANNEVKFNLPVIEALDKIKKLDSEKGMRMGIQAIDLDEMEISWNRHIIYHKFLLKTTNLKSYIEVEAENYSDSNFIKNPGNGDVASSPSITPPPSPPRNRLDFSDDEDVAFSNQNTPSPPSSPDLTHPGSTCSSPLTPEDTENLDQK